MRRNTRKEETFTAIAEMIGLFGGYIEAESKKYQLPSVNTDSDFRRMIAASLEKLL